MTGDACFAATPVSSHKTNSGVPFGCSLRWQVSSKREAEMSWRESTNNGPNAKGRDFDFGQPSMLVSLSAAFPVIRSARLPNRRRGSRGSPA